MSGVLKPALILLVICAVISGALALTYDSTSKIIAAGDQAAINDAMAVVLPDSEFTELEISASAAGGNPEIQSLYRATKNGVDAGYVATVIAKGYGGDMTIIVGIDADNNISGVRVSSHSETPGLGDRAAKPDFYNLFNGKSTSSPLAVAKGDAADSEISAISGATISSNAVVDAVNAAADAIKNLK